MTAPSDPEVTWPKWYAPPHGAVGDDRIVDAINELRTTYQNDRGWLSTLVWNTRNNVLFDPDCTVSATQVRMLVEGFLAEIEALKSTAGAVE